MLSRPALKAIYCISRVGRFLVLLLFLWAAFALRDYCVLVFMFFPDQRRGSNYRARIHVDTDPEVRISDFVDQARLCLPLSLVASCCLPFFFSNREETAIVVVRASDFVD